MSRIHEALQRAGEQPPAGAEVVDEPLPSESAETSSEITALSREPFPVEIAGARTPRVPQPQEPPAKESAGGPWEHQHVHEPDPGPASPAGEPRKSLFERIDSRLAEKVVVDANMSQMSREQYRRLAAVLHDAQSTNGLRVVMVASAVPGEGKTLTATNVALTLSDSYRRRVLLIDADLRKPTMHEIFRLNTATGLIDGLESPNEVKLVLRQVSPTLSVLPAGRPTTDPMAALTSERMRHLIDEAKEAFDWVIIDTPPLMLLPDAHLLTTLVDGAVLVVKAAATPHEMVKRSAEILGRNKIIGVVLNHAAGNAHPGYGGYYGRYYMPEPTPGNRP
jgi:protein-tyrosine kinase